MSIDIINQKRIKLVVNGGCLNPRGLAEKTHELVSTVRSYLEKSLTISRSPQKA